MLGANKTRNVRTGPQGGLSLFYTDGAEKSWVVPTGVTSIDVLAIGAGGGGAAGYSTQNRRAGGGGGALVYSKNLAVTPGETLTLCAGLGGTNSGALYSSGTAGGNTYIKRGAVNLIMAAGGSGGNFGNSIGIGGQASDSIGQIKFSGGDGTSGGGGSAGGYTANGAQGSANGTGGAGGGGGYYWDGPDSGSGISGGGTFPWGITGYSGNAGGFYESGKMGSHPTGLQASMPYLTGRNNRLFGGGGGGGSGDGYSGGTGGYGALRILWNYDNVITAPFLPIAPTVVASKFVATNAGSTTLPTGIEAGDVVLIIQIAFGYSLYPSAITQTGFVRIRQTSFSNADGYRGQATVNGTVATNSSLSGSTVNLMTENQGYSNWTAILVLRSPRGIDIANFYNRGVSDTFIPGTSYISGSGTYFYGHETGLPILIGMFTDTSYISSANWSGATFIETGIPTIKFCYKFQTLGGTSTESWNMSGSYPCAFTPILGAF